MKFVKLKNPVMVELGSAHDPNYLFVDIIDEALHEDITSMDNIHDIGALTGRDYLFLRDCLIELIVAKGGFDSLTEDEKWIASWWIIATKDQALTILTSSEFDAAVDNYGTQAYKARANRKELSAIRFRRDVIKGEMTYHEVNQFWIDSKDLLNNWCESANPGFLYWIQSINAYAGNGFAEKSYYTPMRKQYLVDYIINGKILLT